MDIVKYYVSPYIYKNCICVNKEWKSIFLTMNHVSEFHCKLCKEGWFTPFTHNVVKERSLTTLELLKCLIETLEEPNKIRYYPFRPYKRITPILIKKNTRLNFINLDGM